MLLAKNIELTGFGMFPMCMSIYIAQKIMESTTNILIRPKIISFMLFKSENSTFSPYRPGKVSARKHFDFNLFRFSPELLKEKRKIFTIILINRLNIMLMPS